MAVDFGSLATRQDNVDIKVGDIKQKFQGRKIEIVGEKVDYITKVLDVEISSSVIDFKNIFLKIQKNSKSERIEPLDEVHVDFW